RLRDGDPAAHGGGRGAQGGGHDAPPGDGDAGRAIEPSRAPDGRAGEPDVDALQPAGGPAPLARGARDPLGCGRPPPPRPRPRPARGAGRARRRAGWSRMSSRPAMARPRPDGAAAPGGDGMNERGDERISSLRGEGLRRRDLLRLAAAAGATGTLLDVAGLGRLALAQAPAAPKKGGTLTVGINTDLVSLDPTDILFANVPMFFQLYNYLVTFGTSLD